MKLRFILNNLIFPAASVIYLRSVRFASSGRSSDFWHFANILKALCGSAKCLITRRSWSCPPARGAETNINKQTRQSRKMSDTPLRVRLLSSCLMRHNNILQSWQVLFFFFQSQLKVSCNINVGVVLEMTSIPHALSARETHRVLLLFKRWISCQIYGCSIRKS